VAVGFKLYQVPMVHLSYLSNSMLTIGKNTIDS